MTPLTLDFETKAIGLRPEGYPPEPVGVALKIGSARGRYYAWGHPVKNNCTRAEATQAVFDAVCKTDALVCHNLPFDLAILNERLNIALRGHRLIDTQVLAFLANPYANDLGLKPLAEEYLGEPPEERDAVREWLIEHKIVAKNATRQWGSHICDAPGNVVGRYAVGDVERTYKLMRFWRALLETEAFEREMALQPVLMAMERRGVPVNGPALKRTLEQYETALADNETRLRHLLHAPGLDIQKGAEVADAIMGAFPDAQMVRTPTGRISTARAALDAALPDGLAKASLMYDSSLRQTLKMFLRPWAAQNARTPGRLHPQWHGTRGEDGGARTGRLSSSPNLQNLNRAQTEADLLAKIRQMAHEIYWGLPVLRDLVQAPPGHLLIGRDYSQIELRVTAHYEDGPMAEHYCAEPTWDLHQWMVDKIKAEYGRTITRTVAKNIGFGIIYGAGAGAIAAQSGLSEADGAALKRVYLDMLPSMAALMQDVKGVGFAGERIVTLGQRTVGVQPPTVKRDKHGQVIDSRSYEYKFLNYLIQGGCADLMKQAMIDIEKRGIPLVMSIHDEPVALVKRGPMKYIKEVSAEMNDAMINNVVAKRIDIPLLTEGYYATKWASKKEVK